MSVGSIVLIVVILILLYAVIYYIVKDASTLSSNVTDGTAMTTITPGQLSSDNGSSGNFSYSVWFNIDDWNYRYGETKVILGRSATVLTSSTGSAASASGAGADASSGSGAAGSTINVAALQPCPFIVLAPKMNNLIISVTCYSSNAAVPASGTAPLGIVHNVEITNVPIQRWTHLFISVYGRTLDIYIDGKLVRTGILPGTANVNPNANLYLTPGGGFWGWTSKLQYWNNASDPQMVWNIYKKGYGQGLFGSLFGKYKVQVSLLTDNTTTSQITI